LCGDKSLKEAFLDLYGANDAFVVAHLEISDYSNQWNVSFARVAHSWVVSVFASLFNLLYSVRGRQKSEDKLWWALSKKRIL
jgi:hypothetical protein